MFASLIAFLTANWAILAGGTGAAVVASVFLPKILALAPVQYSLGWILQFASICAIPFAKWLKMGPLKHVVVLPLLLLQIAGAFFMRFNDRVLNELDDSARTMAKGIADALAKVKSTDQRLYYQAKGMNQEQVDAVTGIAAGVMNRAKLAPEDQDALDRAVAAGAALQGSRLN